MAARLLVLTDRYFRALARLGIRPKSRRARGLASVLLALESDELLPAPQDSRVVIPPTISGFVRRVPSANLWVWYTVEETRVIIQAVTSNPPTPIE